MNNKELVAYVLERVPVHVFNESVKSFSTQRLYAYVKRDMLREFPMFENSQLVFAVKMAEAFRPYTVYEINGMYPTDAASQVDRLRREAMLFKPGHPKRGQLTDEYNKLVDMFNAGLKPQNDLIKLYKRIQKDK